MRSIVNTVLRSSFTVMARIRSSNPSVVLRHVQRLGGVSADRFARKRCGNPRKQGEEIADVEVVGGRTEGCRGRMTLRDSRVFSLRNEVGSYF